jgi:hypothetical protein
MKNTFQVLKKFPHLQSNHLRNSFEGNNWTFFLKYLSSCGLLRRKRNWVTFSASTTFVEENGNKISSTCL